MPSDHDVAALARRLAIELAECRQRGIERLDVRTHNQSPVTAPDLHRLAQAYVTSEGLAVHGRVAVIKQLLWDGLAAMGKRNGADAELVRDLYFGNPPPVAEEGVIGGAVRLGRVTANAGDLLEYAAKKSGLTRAKFYEQRTAAFATFGEFLVEFAAPFLSAIADDPADPADAEGVRAARLRDDGHGDAATGTHSLRTGHVNDGRFVQLLSEAVNATIVGYTNEHLTEMLDTALSRKAAAQGNPEAFWGSLRVVFCQENVLEAITDERFPDPAEALRQRKLAAFHGRRSLTVFLRRRITASRWPIYESSFVPPFIGTLFELPTGHRMVHLLIRSPQRRSADHLYLELEETADQYFSGVFEDIVHNCVPENTVVPVGVPRADTFECSGSRYRHNVLIRHSGAVGWLPYVLVVTWRRRDDHAEPLLQLRTEANAERELDRLTHPVTPIHQEDFDETGSGTAAVPPRIELDDPVAKRAASRRVLREAGEDLPGDVVPRATSQYLHHDRENLFFFVYSREVPADFQFPRRADIFHVPFEELLAIVSNQALRKAELFARAPTMSARARAAAAEITALNLALHGHPDLAEELTELAAKREPALGEFAARVSELIEQTRQPWYSAGREVDIKGLSGLHYREFFTLLLPLYAQLGVRGAAEHLDRVRADASGASAIARLADLYRDTELMMAIPVEL